MTAPIISHEILLNIFIASVVIAIHISFPATAADAPPVPQSTRLCNGSAALCSRRYTDATFPGTHNSMSNRDQQWDFPNQEHSVEAQLESGVRVINLDLYMYEGEPYTCHSSCKEGKRKLSDTLAGIKNFMDSYPDDVITLELCDDTVGAGALEPTFAKSGLLKYALEQKKGAPWPTLGEMLDAGKRLVIFGGFGGRPWYLAESDFLWSSPWDFKKIKDFKCGAPDGRPIYMMQHFILNPYPMEIYAKKANNKKVIVDRALQCWRETGQRPNIIIVDFSTLGDVVKAAAELNEYLTLPTPAANSN